MKKNKLISIICPTHKRPALQRRFAKCVYENCYDPRYSEIVFGIDEDDQVALDVAEELKKQYDADPTQPNTLKTLAKLNGFVDEKGNPDVGALLNVYIPILQDREKN